MRVIAGSAKGHRLMLPRGIRTRPTTDRVRRALVDSLGPVLTGARFLDLFAGSGVVGIEALSRGAAYCVFVERSRRAAEAILRNLAACHFPEVAQVLALQFDDALDHLADARERFNIVFLDPPYRDTAACGQALEQLAARPVLLAPDATIIAQHFSKVTLPTYCGPLHQTRLRQFGETALTTYTTRDEAAV